VELIEQHTKRIMEGCKGRAREAGLRFHDETLEYIVSNRDLLELGPKYMIPTLYDYWVHDVEVLKEKGRYDLYPHNPYETVVNTRPAISFYNDNNPDWLNVMIFYHVLAHIDFFQNNMLFKHTWDEDFAGRALSDKRTIAMLRSQKGRWVDYVIEFTRGIDNLVGFFPELSKLNHPSKIKTTKKLDFYFGHFLQTVLKTKLGDYLKEIERYNQVARAYGERAEGIFFLDVTKKHPEIEALFDKEKGREKEGAKDLIQYLYEHSSFLRKEENLWMKSVMEIVRKTSIFFQPQIRTKILNEGWASYWHEKLFLKDDRIRGNEVGFARVNAGVTALPRVGLNPYALGMRLFTHIEDLSGKGRLSYSYQKLQNERKRQAFDGKNGSSLDTLLAVREDYSDFMFINTFLDQAFVDKHRLFVAGRRLNNAKGVWEYYVKSRNAADYKQMLLDSLYHPPYVDVDESKTAENCLYLNHHYEGKGLVREFIPNTMLGISYLWGGPVKLETTESSADRQEPTAGWFSPATPSEEKKPRPHRVVYTMEERKLSKTVL
jgi:stage V sporulation protein R